MRRNGFAYRVCAILADGECLRAASLARRLDMELQNFQVNMSWLQRNNPELVSRTVKDGRPFYWYYLTPEQLANFRKVEAKFADKEVAKLTLPVNFQPLTDADPELVLSAADCADRMAFIRHLEEKTIFKDWPIVARMRRDYERALKRSSKTAKVPD